MTAVEYLAKELEKPHTEHRKAKIIQKALEMEREQMEQPVYAKPGDYCAVCGCQEFWSREDQEDN